MVDAPAFDGFARCTVVASLEPVNGDLASLCRERLESVIIDRLSGDDRRNVRAENRRNWPCRENVPKPTQKYEAAPKLPRSRALICFEYYSSRSAGVSRIDDKPSKSMRRPELIHGRQCRVARKPTRRIVLTEIASLVRHTLRLSGVIEKSARPCVDFTRE